VAPFMRLGTRILMAAATLFGFTPALGWGQPERGIKESMNALFLTGRIFDRAHF